MKTKTKIILPIVWLVCLALLLKAIGYLCYSEKDVEVELREAIPSAAWRPGLVNKVVKKERIWLGGGIAVAIAKKEVPVETLKEFLDQQQGELVFVTVEFLELRFEPEKPKVLSKTYRTSIDGGEQDLVYQDRHTYQQGRREFWVKGNDYERNTAIFHYNNGGLVIKIMFIVALIGILALVIVMGCFWSSSQPIDEDPELGYL